MSTSYVERQNLNFRMGNRRFTRLTNGFSKKLQNHAYQVALYTVFYNFCRICKTLRMTPAMSAGVTDTLRDVGWIVGLIEARTPPPGSLVLCCDEKTHARPWSARSRASRWAAAISDARSWSVCPWLGQSVRVARGYAACDGGGRWRVYGTRVADVCDGTI